MPREAVDEPRLLGPPLLTLNQVPVYPRLKLVLVVGDGVEAEIEKALAVAISDGFGDEEAKQRCLVVRMGAPQTKKAEWSQLVANSESSVW